MIISIDEEKVCDKIQHPVMIKTLQNMGTEGTYLNIVKAVYDKPTANIILNGEKLKACSAKIKNKTKAFIFTTIIKIVMEVQATAIREEKKKKIKGIQIRKEVELSLFVDDMTLYIENPKDSIRKLLELISEFSKVAEYKTHTHTHTHTHRNHLHFYILTMKNQKQKLRNQSHSPLQQKELNI